MMFGPTDLPKNLHALTLHQPWAWAMFHGKSIENRTWHPPRFLLRQVVAIHAGKTYDTDGYEVICGLLSSHVGVPCPQRHEAAYSAILGLGRLVRSVDYFETPPLPLPRPPAAAPCGCRGITHTHGCPYLSPWFFGPVGWVFESMLLLPEPITSKGARGFWCVKGEVRERLEGALQAFDAARGVSRET